jgi:hypothetical protein
MVTQDELLIFGTPMKNPFRFFLGSILLFIISPAITHVFTPRGGGKIGVVFYQLILIIYHLYFFSDSFPQLL